MNFAVTVYQQKVNGQLVWHTVGLGTHDLSQSGKSPTKLARRLADLLRASIRQLSPAAIAELELVRGRRLRRVRLDVSLGPEGRISGLMPLILEPRHTAPDQRVTLVYHPLRSSEYFVLDDRHDLETQAKRFFAYAWRGLSAESATGLLSDGRDLLRSFAFNETVPQLVESIRAHDDDVFADLQREEKGKKTSLVQTGRRELRAVAENVTLRMADDPASVGSPREPWRTQLLAALGGIKRTPVVLVGPPGCGKTTLLLRCAADLLDADDYAAHRNLDRVREVWRTNTRRILAGMKYVGDWEQRATQIVRETGDPRVILWIEDLHAFGRAGRTRDSDRTLSDVFRGAVQRGECTLIGEATPSEWHRLTEDAPTFADRFTVLRVVPTDEQETFRLMLHEVRELERARKVRFQASAYRAVLSLGETLHPGSAQPGIALDLLRRLAMDVSFDREAERDATGAPQIDARTALRFMVRRTGLPEALLEPETTLDTEDLARRFRQHVIGQDEAVDAAVDLVTRIRAGLVDPSRPFATYLFTGPTGTGKTQMARAIAGFLYGDEDRLVRFDMGEMSGPDAVPRLIGDRFDPRGALTEAIRQQPFSVVLLDEIEKAHPAVLSLLLQLLDEGRLTDASGETADFRRAVIIMTSNLGGGLRSTVGFGERPTGDRAAVMRAVRSFFVPELFNRIDQIVPFEPLGEESANRITEKELAQLLARRGLSDRRVFVFAHEEAVRGMAREAFDAWAGARSVKRYLERTVGALLSDELARRSAAEMRVVHIAGRGGGDLRLHVDELEEAQPDALVYELAGVAAESVVALRRRVIPLLERVRALIDSEGYVALGDTISALTEAGEQPAVVHDLDAFRSAVREVRERVERWAQSVHALEGQNAARKVRRSGWSARRSGQSTSEAFMRDALVSTIAEVSLLERAVPTAADPECHRVMVEMLRVGQGRRAPSYERASDGLLGWLVGLLHRLRGEVVSAAVLGEDGNASILSTPFTPEAVFEGRPQAVALEVDGVAVRALLSGEHGCHVWTSVLSGSEIVRVRVLAVGDGPLAHLRSHRDGVRAFEAALSRGDATPVQDPRHLLPLVRRIRFDPPVRPGERAPIEIEDYRTLDVIRADATSPLDLLESVVWYRASGHEERDDVVA